MSRCLLKKGWGKGGGDLCGRAGVREAHPGLRTALKKEKKSELGLGSGPG